MVQSGDSISWITAGLARAVTSDESLQALGIEATPHLNAVIIRSLSPNTTYAVSTSVGATETLSVGPRGDGSASAIIGGTKTTGNILTIRVFDSGPGPILYWMLTDGFSTRHCSSQRRQSRPRSKNGVLISSALQVEGKYSRESCADSHK